MRTLVAVLGVCCAMGLVACDPRSEPDDPLSCDLPNTGRQLDGEWTLTGRGERQGCQDRRLEGALTLEGEPFAVSAEPVRTQGASTGPTVASEADAFVVRIQRADYELALESGADDALGLEGGVVGSCLSFSVSEDLEGGDRLRYRFDGYITGSGFARGDFWGEGPESCEVTGTFELRVR